jgi:Plasmid pRiA4b ORF-3-like protein
MDLARRLWQVGSMKTSRAIDSFTEIATARIELKDTDPLIWREVEVPTSITLKVLHDIVQATIGWMDYHLWEFVIDGRAYGLPDDEDWGTAPRKEAAKVRLRDVLNSDETIITYTYDFGDDWVHIIRITDVRQGDAGIDYPRYIAGERNGPPEDCGGVPGFYGVLDARADPDQEEHETAVTWLDDYDPDTIEELPIKYALGRIAARRNAARTRLAKTKNV